MRPLILFGIILGAILLIMQLARYRLLFMLHSESLYTAFIALLCCAVGIWAGLSWRKNLQHRKATAPPIQEPLPGEGRTHHLSPREMEVLQLMAAGLSNQEIAEALFVSLNTIKTHGANIFAKLDVRWRTQAIQKAKSLGLLP